MKVNQLLFSTSLVLALTACNLDNSDNDKKNQPSDSIVTPDPKPEPQPEPEPEPEPENSLTVISTVASGYTSSAVQFININDQYSVSSSQLAKVKSDYTVASAINGFYHLGKYNIDEISLYTSDDLQSAQYTYSAIDNPEDDSANPYTVIDANKELAFVIRYASDKVWVVNPSAEEEADYKIGELDLSAYNAGDMTPDAFDAVIADNKLFIAMQQLTGYTADRAGSIAVFDLDTLEEIDTNPNDDDANPKGIELSIYNPIALSYHPDTGILIAGVDNYNSGSYHSGIEAVNTSDYSTTVLVDDGDDAESSLYGAFYKIAVVDADNAYFVGYSAWQDSALYHFNPNTGVVSGAVEGFSNLNISLLAADPNGQAWVGIGDDADPRVHVLNNAQSEVVEISLAMNPNGIAFVTE